MCAAIGASCAIIFSQRKDRKTRILSVTLLGICLLIAPFIQSWYPVKVHQDKRQRGEDFRAGAIKLSTWSFLSKIEVAMFPKKSGMIWFDGGVMQSSIDRFDGNYSGAINQHVK